MARQYEDKRAAAYKSWGYRTRKRARERKSAETSGSVKGKPAADKSALDPAACLNTANAVHPTSAIMRKE